MAILNFPPTNGEPIDGSFTYTDNGVLYSWDGYKWTSVTTGEPMSVFQENNMIQVLDHTLTAGRSALSAGPITILEGAVVTIPDNQNWVIL
tara:strand:+ start:953 stop:1225 length:273 start_codon:yes stop_codon:yes gene_type:complete